MRERLAVTFALLAVCVLLVAGVIRTLALEDLFREQEMDNLQHEAELVVSAIDAHRASGMPVKEEFLAGLVEPDTRLEYVGPEGEIAVTGSDFENRDPITASATSPGGVDVKLTAEPGQADGVYTEQVWGWVTMVVLISLLAALGGWWAARWLAAPFRTLAGAAEALGRGRFDVELPDTRIPEARAIGQALKASAAQLESRLSRESEFAAQASHQLRTPLTSLRLELEDLTLRPDVPEDVQDAAKRCIARVDAVNGVAEELVSLTRTGALVEGAQLMLGELATQITQRWADRLGPARRPVTARAEGELGGFFTPGPLEQILDALLDDVERGTGPVRLVFEGSDSHVRVVVPAGVAGEPPLRGVEVAEGLARPQGGRIRGDLVESDLEILMPRR